MAHYYLDTNAIVKRYVQEEGSAWVRLLTGEPNHTLLISELAIAETSAAISILRRVGRLSKRHSRDAHTEFRADLNRGRYQTVRPSLSIIESAADLAQDHPLKAYDAIHLATAINLQKQLVAYRASLTFVCSDRQVLRAAAAEGLATENPFDYAHLDR
jgi:predicted nucleic acid-binding protein